MNNYQQLRFQTIQAMVVILALIFSQNTWAQWQRVYNSATTDRIYDVFFPTPDTGYAVGYCHCLYKTIDGGDTWLTTPLDAGFSSVFFVNANLGYIASSGSYLYKTYDGGQNWESKWPDFYPFISFSDLHFLNPDTGWITKYHPGLQVFKTYDGCDSYHFVDMEYATSTWSVKFTSKQIGYIFAAWAGNSGDNVIFATQDSGDTWTDWDTTQYFTHGFLDAFFVNDTIAYAHDRSRLFKTTDGSKSWTEIPTDLPHPISIGIALFLPNYERGLHFASPEVGYLWDGARIFRTTNGGYNWVQTDINTNGMYQIFCLNNDTCFATGAGKIYKTTNGGGIASSIGEAAIPGFAFSLSPNPAQTLLHLNMAKSTAEALSVAVYNTLGAVVAEEKLPPQTRQYTINIAALPPGMYFLAVKGENGAIGRRFVKNER